MAFLNLLVFYSKLILFRFFFSLFLKYIFQLFNLNNMTLQQKNINLILNSYTQKDFLSKIKILSEKSILVEDQEMFSDLYFFMRYLFKIEIDVEKWILERSKHYMSEDEFFARIKINSLNIKNSCDFMIFLHELIEMNFIYVYKRPILRVITSAS